MVSADHYSQELNAQFGRAVSRGMSHILINARELHASLGDFPSVNVRYLLPRAAH